MSWCISFDPVFHGDHESVISFGKTCISGIKVKEHLPDFGQKYQNFGK